jgi:pimeloyl-ACP methyl ester carboxylesterase
VKSVRLLISGEEPPRSIALEEAGQESARDTLLCLPGLLETHESFGGLVGLLGNDHRIFLMDYAGRGDSDPMPEASQYRMSRYLGDIGVALAYVQGRLTSSTRPSRPRDVQPPMRIHLVGTSMGGILAMSVAAQQPNGIASVVLNDVACLLPWAGIFGLMTGLGTVTKGASFFGNHREVADDLRIDHRLLRAVQQPKHLDVAHQTTVHGVDFRETFSQVRKPVLLLKSGRSEVVNDQAVEATRACNPLGETVVLPEAGHPAPYDETACAAIRRFVATA